jgi:PTS system mannose-specific IIB component
MSQIGIVVASHGTLAQSLIATAELIVGAQDALAAACLDPQDSLETCCDALQAALAAVDQDAGVMVLIDLFGGTPGNAAALGLSTRSYPVIAGVNLPMLLEVLMSRESAQSPDELAQIALQAGHDGIINVGARLLAQRESDAIAN